MKTEHWTKEPDKKDYPAALNYLSLLMNPREAERIVKALKAKSRIDHFAAKDLLRASGLSHLGADDHEVEKDLDKVKSGERLSPVLLVRGAPLLVADGYHRICASYHLSEDEIIPCRIVERSSGKLGT
ncbi:MAG: hypothetical protein HKL85_03770 [Acidimicrobiaceae bacterium]|nr:hypothetical protein [Acidimicrobiaceae bacterium]